MGTLIESCIWQFRMMNKQFAQLHLMKLLDFGKYFLIERVGEHIVTLIDKATCKEIFHLKMKMKRMEISIRKSKEMEHSPKICLLDEQFSASKEIILNY